MTHADPARRAGGRVFQRSSLVALPLPPAAALLPSALPPLLARAVLLLRFLLGPLPRRLTARIAAIVPPSTGRTELTPAPLQKASPPTRATEGSLHSPSKRIILKGAHGRSQLPKAHAPDESLSFIRGDSSHATEFRPPPPISSTLLPLPHNVTSIPLIPIPAQFRDHQLPATRIGRPDHIG